MAYDASDMPFIDAKVAGFLCPGGPIIYKIAQDSPVTNNWIVEYATIVIAALLAYGCSIAMLLYHALL